jgi:uncharacterized membrane protein YozB (DUF420 family)
MPAVTWDMLTGPLVILILKVAVITVTAILLAALAALVRGNYRLHGRLNVAFAVLTIGAVLGLELLVRFVDPNLFDYFDPDTKQSLFVHVCFSVPAATLLPLMLYTGLTHRRTVHLVLAFLFSVFWIGTVVTGVFFLPHE